MTERKRPAKRRGELRRDGSTWAGDLETQEEALRYLLRLAEEYRASGRLLRWTPLLRSGENTGDGEVECESIG